VTIVYAAYVPNAPFLIAPAAFGGAGQGTVQALGGLDVPERYRPEVIVVSSPHWVSPSGFRVNVSARPRQIFDFSGFPEALSQVRYAPEGEPGLARRIVEAAHRAGVPAETTAEWGLDHGAWAPLLHLVPEATVPVLPTSIVARDPELHRRWGRALREVLEHDGRRIAFLATGSIVHNFGRFDPDPRARWPEGEAIEREMVTRVLDLDAEGLARFDRRKWELVQPEGALGPLFTLLGTLAAPVRTRQVFHESAFGGFSLTTIEFVPEELARTLGAPQPTGPVTPPAARGRAD